MTKPTSSTRPPLRPASDSARPGALTRWSLALGRRLGLDRRRAPDVPIPNDRRRAHARANVPQHLCDELSSRMLGLSHAQAAEVMQHLVLVHDALSRRGWAGVEALPARVLGRALLQAEILGSEGGSSPTLESFIDRLRQLQSQVARRDEEDGYTPAIRVGEDLVVSESTFAEFNDLERGWAGTVPSRLDEVDRETTD